MLAIRSHHLQVAPDRILLFFFFFGKMNKFFISDWSAGELLAPAGRVYLDPGEG